MRRDIAEAVETGCPPYTAAKMFGVADHTLDKWLMRGRRGEEPFCTLVAAIDQASARCVYNKLVAMNQAAESGHWGAAAWLLERLDGRYRLDSRVTLGGDVARPVRLENTHRVDVAGLLSDEAMAKILATAMEIHEQRGQIIDVEATFVAPRLPQAPEPNGTSEEPPVEVYRES